MSAALKKLSDQDKTSEFQIPEEILKKQTQKIREEHAAVEKELHEIKNEQAVRGPDEATQVFQLRQLEVNQKVEELENKKAEFEQQMLSLLEKQKTKMSGDLQKVSKYIQQETKKKETFDKGLLTRLSTLAVTQSGHQQQIHELKSELHETKNLYHELKIEIGILKSQKEVAVVETKSSEDLLAKKALFQKHLEAILSPEQQEIVGEMLEDLFKALKIRK